MNNLNTDTKKRHCGLLTQNALRDLFGANYNNIFYYNFDIKKFGSTYKEVPFYMGTPLSVNEKALQYCPRALNYLLAEYNMQLAAAVVMLTGQHDMKRGELIKNPTFDKNGRNIVGTIVTRNMITSDINPYNGNWVSLGQNGLYECTCVALHRGFGDFMSDLVNVDFNVQPELVMGLLKTQLTNSR